MSIKGHKNQCTVCFRLLMPLLAQFCLVLKAKDYSCPEKSIKRHLDLSAFNMWPDHSSSTTGTSFHLTVYWWKAQSDIKNKIKNEKKIGLFLRSTASLTLTFKKSNFIKYTLLNLKQYNTIALQLILIPDRERVGKNDQISSQDNAITNKLQPLKWS